MTVINHLKIRESFVILPSPLLVGLLYALNQNQSHKLSHLTTCKQLNTTFGYVNQLHFPRINSTNNSFSYYGFDPYIVSN